MKLFAARILLMTVTAAACVIGLEWALRLQAHGQLTQLPRERFLRVPHPTRGWVLAPSRRAQHRTLEYDVLVETNAHGLRDREHDFEKPEGVFRIVVLGDSFMEAYQVHLEEALPYRLQELLGDRSVEVVNLGVGGYGTAQSLRALEDQGMGFAPDLVLLAFFTGNDIQNNHRRLQIEILGADDPKVFGRPFATSSSMEAPLVWNEPDYARMQRRQRDRLARRKTWRYRAWKLVQPKLLENRVSRLFAGVAGTLGATPANPEAHFGWAFLEGYKSEDWDEAWLVTRRLLLALGERSTAGGARFAVLLVPSKLQVEPEFRELARSQYPGIRFDETQVNRALAAFLDEHGIPLVDPTPALVREHAAGRPTYYQIDDHHWNANGHRVATAAMVDALGRAELLPGP